MAEVPAAVLDRATPPRQRPSPAGGVRAPLDAVGAALALTLIGWIGISAALAGGSPWPPVALLLGCGLALLAGRLIGSIEPILLPGAIVILAVVLMVASPLGTWSSAPLAGPFGYANAKAAFFGQAAVAAAMAWATLRGPRLRRVALVAAVLFASVAWFSGSFAAAIPLLLLPAAVWMSSRRPGWIAGVSAAVLILVIGGTIVAARVPSAPGERLTEGLTSHRVELWGEAVTMAQAEPWTGVGPGTFGTHSALAEEHRDLRWAHSGFLQQAAESGLPGFALLVLLFIWAFVRLAAQAGPLAGIAAFGLLVLGLQASVDYVLHFPGIPLVAASMIGVATAPRRRRRALRPGAQRRVAHVSTVDVTLRFVLRRELGALRAEGYEVTAISAPGRWAADLGGIRHLDWPHVSRSWNPIRDLRAAMALERILARERFDIVHTHTPKAAFIGRIVARLLGTPAVVNTVHGYYAMPDDPLLKRALVLGAEGVAAWCSDLELFVSETDLAWAHSARLIRPGQGRLLGQGVDLRPLAPVDPARRAALRARLGLHPDDVVVGTVGRMVVEKGIRDLFEAAVIVRRHEPRARFLVVGAPDTDRADAISFEEMEAVEEDVIFTGWQDDVPELLAAMDVFTLPSWREGVPRSAVEAAAMGLPLVVTDIRGCREVVRNGVEGFLVPPRDPVSLAGALTRLIQDPGLRASMGRAARRRAEERFDVKLLTAITVDAYRSLSGGDDGAPVASASVREATGDDVPAVAALHRHALPDSFLPALGDGFLRLLYREMVRDPGALLLVADDGAGVIGFAAGTPSVTRFFRRFRRRNAIRAALLAAPRLLRPEVRRRLRETARYPRGTSSLPDAELLSIAVQDHSQGSGVGRRLAEGILEGLAGLGADEVRVLVATSNTGANRFYERLGFRTRSRIELHVGQPSNVLVARCRS